MSSSGCLGKLQGISLRVAGLSNDFGLTKRELAGADVVEALERVDVGTRNAGALGRGGGHDAFCTLALLVLDKHLLHDTRGPVIAVIFVRQLWNALDPRVVRPICHAERDTAAQEHFRRRPGSV